MTTANDTCGTCDWNDDGFCDRLGRLVEDDTEACIYHNVMEDDEDD